MAPLVYILFVLQKTSDFLFVNPDPLSADDKGQCLPSPSQLTVPYKCCSFVFLSILILFQQMITAHAGPVVVVSVSPDGSLLVL